MSDYMDEVERLIEEYGNAEWTVGRMSEHSDDAEEIVTRENARAALLAHIQRGAVPEGDDGKRVLREVFALCEDTEAKCHEDPSDFNRGRYFEAKGIARAIGAWYQEEFCGRTHMGEPAASAPDQFRDAVAAPAEVPMPQGYVERPSDYTGDIWIESQMRTYSVACRAAGEAAGYARGRADERERICAAIKAEDDYCVTEGDYMLDSEDCISVARGTWERPDYAALRGEVKP